MSDWLAMREELLPDEWTKKGADANPGGASSVQGPPPPWAITGRCMGFLDFACGP
jgi:hypothetical protein